MYNKNKYAYHTFVFNVLVISQWRKIASTHSNTDTSFYSSFYICISEEGYTLMIYLPFERLLCVNSSFTWRRAVGRHTYCSVWFAFGISRWKIINPQCCICRHAHQTYIVWGTTICFPRRIIVHRVAINNRLCGWKAQIVMVYLYTLQKRTIHMEKMKNRQILIWIDKYSHWRMRILLW